ncbi:MAG: Arc family DNA-binding protein [Lachnospiraceae bacterium]|mgnify:CR=1 FL=1|nr:Arc family DNA-binding protein [Lachnospiraceae bacterium]MDE6759866.1 Arc family DNA-binding protein [Lachnospiraceae bacterium]
MLLKLSKFTIRIDSVLLKKFRFVAEYNGRSANHEIEILMKKHVAEFEKRQEMESDLTPWNSI